MRVIVGGSRKLGHTPKRPKPTPEDQILYSGMRDFVHSIIVDSWKSWKDAHGPITEVVVSDDPGVSSVARDLAVRISGKSAKCFTADWFRKKNKAAVARDDEMMRYSDGGIFILDDGSWQERKMARDMERAGIPVIIYTVDKDLISIVGFPDSV